MSNSEYNLRTDDIVVAAVTSNLEQKEYAVIFTNKDMAEGNLKVDSCIRTDKVYTLSKYIVVNKFGKVKEEVLKKSKRKNKYFITRKITYKINMGYFIGLQGKNAINGFG